MSNSRVYLTVLAAVLACSVASPGYAQSVCGDRAQIIKVLDTKYKEMPRAFGIAGQKNLVELFTSKSGSWTMLMTQPKGVTCILATGQSWEELPPTQKLTGL
jgi:hypothetical protein